MESATRHRADMISFFTFDSYISIVGVAYTAVGLLGVFCNVTTVVMILTNRVFRLSAYTIMANVALADSIVMLIAGVACGMDVMWPNPNDLTSFIPSLEEPLNTVSPIPLRNDTKMTGDSSETGNIHAVLSFSFVAAWTAGVISYAMLGMNRCIAICYYGTKARALNQVSVAIACSASTWVIGVGAALVGTLSQPMIGIQRTMWSISFLEPKPHTTLFFTILCAANLFGLGAQWVCSTLVLLKIRQVKKKISKNKLNQNSANRFRKQARLTFQFFYPSILCTISTFLFFIKPYAFEYLSGWQLVILHLLWLCNHTCNPFIYAYFNDRMRMTYKEILTCAAIRYQIRKRRSSHPFRMHGRHNVSKRSNAAGMKSTRISARSGRTNRDGNFVRNSLQMQSRDFEQLCEFIMRVNPLYDSSEGWRESSDDEPFQPEFTKELESVHNAGGSSRYDNDREAKSIVLDLGRQTVEHWVKFAKKASI
ncbi:Protein CBG15435 [Caenorhabditis briggsae]|nr:Protein CBG15435 [Caenorhabditis briggsae]ULT83921.1 hypothetical protein L3Y34_012901 [Caenorhabditis briggsae]UMM43165.1 hypothetical protein L5515_018753 [Caenorhabditis briggsae]CAP33781.2 Protein CBG15435 [Caenorhabditis briggsae]